MSNVFIFERTRLVGDLLSSQLYQGKKNNDEYYGVNRSN